MWEISPQRCVFAHPAFLQALEQAFGHRLQLAAVEEKRGWSAGIPIFERRRGPFLAAALPHLTPVLSPLLRAGIGEADTHNRRSALDALIAELAARYHQVTLQLHPSLADVRPFVWSGWTVSPRFTHIADLQCDDPVSAWAKSVRYTIRTESDAFRVDEGKHLIEAGIRLLFASYDRKGMKLGLDKATLAHLAVKLEEAGLVRVFGALRVGAEEPEAVALIAHDGRDAHYWMAGSKPGPGMAVLLAQAVPTLKDSGIRSLDFVGSNVPSVAEFKRKYGTVLRPYYQARLVNNPILRAMDRFRPTRS